MRSVVFAAILLVGLGTSTIASRQGQPSSSDSQSTQTAAAQAGSHSLSSDDIAPERMRKYSDSAVRWLREYLRINTTNPPGNEIKSAEFLKRLFDAEGIESRIFEFAPGRANLWARIPCSLKPQDCKRPFVLLNHMDVVAADAAHWRVPPFSGAVVNGSIYGRGAQDMKNEGITQAVVMLMLQRERAQLNRDVIFLATGDEEVDDAGSKYMMENQRALLGRPEFLITEGGDNSYQGSGVAYVSVDVAEKAPFWLHVVARGEAGHGSHPIPDSAPNRLLTALQRIRDYKPTLRVVPVVEDYLRAMAPMVSPGRAQQFLNIRYLLTDTEAYAQIATDDSLSDMLQDTIAVTMMGGAPQTNVIPGEAWANLDVRLLPDTDPQQFLEALRRQVDDPSVTIEPMKPYSQPNESPRNTELWQAIRSISYKYFDGAPVVPRMTSGYTESQIYRQLGTVCYGFSPFATTIDESGTEHGSNEHVRIDEVRHAPRILYDLVLQVAGK